MKLSFFDIRSGLPQGWRELVTPQRQQRAQRYLRSEDRLRCLGAGILLARELGVSRDEEIVYGPWGKPGLRDKSAQFSLSHAGDLVVLAISFKPLGVDIEKIRPIPFEQGELARFLSPREVLWLRENGSAEDFFRLWTGKEALMKATGRGLSQRPESFCLLPLTEGEPEGWDMIWRPMEGYILCTAEQKSR